MPNLIPVIPAYNPDELLLNTVKQLIDAGFERIVIVNDGSDADAKPVFDQLAKTPFIDLLGHACNLGKGAALKTAINHCAVTYPDADGVITLDADGQHAVEDVKQLACEFSPNALLIGVRGFGKRTPWRSRIGNWFTKHIFRFLTGQGLQDTQSGLRVIPKALFHCLLKLKSNGYEFELDMLMVCHRLGVNIKTQPISTIYLEGNVRSHFRPLIDSMRIYFVLLRFSLISVMSAVIDYAIFVVIILLGHSLLTAMVVARILSMLFNYFVVKQLAFHSAESHGRTFPRYLALAVISGGLAFFMIQGLVENAGMNVVIAKVISEFFMFIVNFLVQRDLIFKRRN